MYICLAAPLGESTEKKCQRSAQVLMVRLVVDLFERRRGQTVLNSERRSYVGDHLALTRRDPVGRNCKTRLVSISTKSPSGR